MEEAVVGKFSGGRSSALACRIALEEGVLDHLVFNNTGLESEQTYEFLEAVNEQWFDGQLVMLEWRHADLPKVCGTPAELSRDGGPMQDYIKNNRLPSMFDRLCTSALKIRTTHAWLHQRYDYRTVKFVSVVGFRSEEASRLARMRQRNEAVARREAEGLAHLKWSDEQRAPWRRRAGPARRSSTLTGTGRSRGFPSIPPIRSST